VIPFDVDSISVIVFRIFVVSSRFIIAALAESYMKDFVVTSLNAQLSIEGEINTATSLIDDGLAIFPQTDIKGLESIGRVGLLISNSSRRQRPLFQLMKRNDCDKHKG
ncbi:15244_t:CDS:2, partial [Dentiscutata erythropus]